MCAVRILPHYTYEDWLNWEGKWELIEGIPFAMSPAPMPKHQYIALNLGSEFRMALRKCNNCKAYIPLDYVINQNTILEPDILIACGKINKEYLDFPPSLVVEILSPSTALKDRHVKFDLYEQQQVKYYLIVSPDTEEVEVYILENRKYALTQKGHDFVYSFVFGEGCEATIQFKEIW